MKDNLMKEKKKINPSLIVKDKPVYTDISYFRCLFDKSINIKDEKNVMILDQFYFPLFRTGFRDSV